MIPTDRPLPISSEEGHPFKQLSSTPRRGMDTIHISASSPGGCSCSKQHAHHRLAHLQERYKGGLAGGFGSGDALWSEQHGVWVQLKLGHRGCSPCFHSPGFHLGSLFLTHTHRVSAPKETGKQAIRMVCFGITRASSLNHGLNGGGVEFQLKQRGKQPMPNPNHACRRHRVTEFGHAQQRSFACPTQPSVFLGFSSAVRRF